MVNLEQLDSKLANSRKKQYMEKRVRVVNNRNFYSQYMKEIRRNIAYFYLHVLNWSRMTKSD